MPIVAGMGEAGGCARLAAAAHQPVQLATTRLCQAGRVAAARARIEEPPLQQRFT
jgi:hypothetical protein